MITSDGSTTIHLPDWNENYHSTHGAIQESKHVFIAKGFDEIDLPEISILEIGFGTGLNCFVTFLDAIQKEKSINYVGVEAYPVTKDEVEKLNYVSELKVENQQEIFDEIHNCSWGEKHTISPDFSLTKRKQFFNEIIDVDQFDLVYFGFCLFSHVGFDSFNWQKTFMSTFLIMEKVHLIHFISNYFILYFANIIF